MNKENTMLAYHNNPMLKIKYLIRVQEHRTADELVQGTGWDRGKGCAVGCTLETYDHARYPIELGIPEQLAYLEDRLFELLPGQDAQDWPERFLSAIPVGADLSRVWFKWAHWMLVDPIHGVIRHSGDRADVRAAIEQVARLCESPAVTAQEWAEAAEAAARAARAAAARVARAAMAAWAAAEAAEAAAEASAGAAGAAAEAAARAARAARAAWAAARAAWAAARAAWAAAEASAGAAARAAWAVAEAAWAAAEAAEWTKAACDELIRLLQEAKP
jgi:hypothetical protein